MFIALTLDFPVYRCLLYIWILSGLFLELSSFGGKFYKIITKIQVIHLFKQNLNKIRCIPLLLIVCSVISSQSLQEEYRWYGVSLTPQCSLVWSDIKFPKINVSCIMFVEAFDEGFVWIDRVHAYNIFYFIQYSLPNSKYLVDAFSSSFKFNLPFSEHFV